MSNSILSDEQAKRIFVNYGIEKEEFEQLHRRGCYMSGRPLEEYGPGPFKTCIDHSHEALDLGYDKRTAVRGLTFNRYNQMLGHYGDSGRNLIEIGIRVARADVAEDINALIRLQNTLSFLIKERTNQ